MQEVFHPGRASVIILFQRFQLNTPSMIRMPKAGSELLVSTMVNLHTAVASRRPIQDTRDWLPSSLRILATVVMFSMVMRSTQHRQITTTMLMVWLDRLAVLLGMIHKQRLITTTTTWLQVGGAALSVRNLFSVIFVIDCGWNSSC